MSKLVVTSDTKIDVLKHKNMWYDAPLFFSASIPTFVLGKCLFNLLFIYFLTASSINSSKSLRNSRVMK